jgi:hypothetical protein
MIHVEYVSILSSHDYHYVIGLLSLSIECKPVIAWGFDRASVVSFIQHETLASSIYECTRWLVAVSILDRHSLKL